MIKNCLFCGKLLNNPTSTKKFCRNRCRQRAYYKRREIGEVYKKPNTSSIQIDTQLTSYHPEIVKPSYRYCINCGEDRTSQKDWFQIFFIENKRRIDRETFILLPVNNRLQYENNKIYCGNCNALYHFG